MTPLESAVAAAVAALHAERGPMDAPATYAALWPYVRAAVAPSAGGEESPPVAPSSDRRVRPWQYTARFWDAAGELVAETDPEVMQGTGSVPEILATLAQQLHGGIPVEMYPAELKARLPQLRNNLGRYGKAVLRIPYVFDGASLVCQLDVYRMEG